MDPGDFVLSSSFTQQGDWCWPRTSFTRPHGQYSINPCRKERGQAPGKSMDLLHSCKAFIDKHVPRKWAIYKNAQWARIGNYWRSSITTTQNLSVECHSPYRVLSFYWCQDMEYRCPCLMATPWKCFFLSKSQVNTPPLPCFLLQGHFWQCQIASLRIECFSEAYHKLNWKIPIESTHIYISFNILLDIRATTTKKERRSLPSSSLTQLERITQTELLFLGTCDKTFDVITVGTHREQPGHFSIRVEIPEVDST